MKADADDVRKSICLIQKTLTSRTARTTHHLKGRKARKSANCISIAQKINGRIFPLFCCCGGWCHIILSSSSFYTNSSMSYLKFSAHFHLKLFFFGENKLWGSFCTSAIHQKKSPIQSQTKMTKKRSNFHCLKVKLKLVLHAAAAKKGNFN